MVELDAEITAGVAFWGYEADGRLLGVMGVQAVRDAELIRHAYVRPDTQGRGLGGALLAHLRAGSDRRLLVGTWAAADWAIRFYRRHGFAQVSAAEKDRLLRTYWTIPDRQVQTSVVLLAEPPLPKIDRTITSTREAGMAREIYTAEATVTGGRAEGHGVTSDGALDVQLRAPSEMGGGGGGTNPEQLFAVGYAACFEGALGVVSQRERVDTGAVSIDSRIGLSPTSSGGFELTIALDVSLPDIADADEAARIVAAAHEVCPYSNATRGNVEVALTANGMPVG